MTGEREERRPADVDVVVDPLGGLDDAPPAAVLTRDLVLGHGSPTVATAAAVVSPRRDVRAASELDLAGLPDHPLRA